MKASSRRRALGALGIVMSVVVAACGAETMSPSPGAVSTPRESVTAPTGSASDPGAGPSLVPTAAAIMPPIASAQPTAAAVVPPVASGSASGASPAPGRPWVPSGSLAALPWSVGAAVSLRDGGAIVVGLEGTVAERWNPATATWQGAAALTASRRDFAAVALRDGRVLVTGGLDTHDPDRWQAYSSSYVYDPSTTAGSWTKVGLLGTARVSPAAAVLPDGRVLVAGGAYKDGPPYDSAGSSGITLARTTSTIPGEGTGGGRRFDDMAPPSIGVALATAELFDPSTGQWSPTGSMRFARAGAAAATLSDGRILVVGPSSSGSGSGDARMDPRAYDTAEVYDPGTGRFSPVGSLPAIDRAAIAADGVDVPTSDPSWTQIGTLVALPDGGALLVGHSDEWKHEGSVTRSFRFDASSGRWRQVGPASAGVNDWKAETWRQTPGVDLAGAFAAAVPGGHVLVAGGTAYNGTDSWEKSRVARLYDPATNTWSSLPPMPTGRQGGMTVALADGSVLFIGGNDPSTESNATTAVRFVPSR
jgi:large repetitive protein